jgi:hypothetical protein
VAVWHQGTGFNAEFAKVAKRFHDTATFCFSQGRPSTLLRAVSLSNGKVRREVRFTLTGPLSQIAGFL